MVPAVVNSINCADCPAFQADEFKDNMEKNNICFKRDEGCCGLGVDY